MSLDEQAKEITILIEAMNNKFNLNLDIPIVGVTSMAEGQLMTIKNMHIVMSHVLNKLNEKEKEKMRSIFLEPQQEIIFSIEQRYNNNAWSHSSKYNYIADKSKFKENKEIYVCDIDRPILNVGELFYLKHINKYVTIQSAVRTSENEVIYRVEDNIFISEEERLHKLELEKEIIEIEKYKEIIEENGKKITELEDIINHIKDIVYNKVFIWTSELKKLLD